MGEEMTVLAGSLFIYFDPGYLWEVLIEKYAFIRI